MKLSVVIVSYKFKEYICQCVDSILAQQTDFGFEVLIRDDGSNDGTIELLNEKYKSVPNVRILDSTTNVGAVENLLILLKEAQGKYIAHIDADDYLIDNKYYQRAVEFLENNPAYSIYCSGCKYLEGDSTSPTETWVVSAKSEIELKDMLVENYVSFGRVFRKTEFRKDLFNDIPYPDWVFNFEILKKGKGFCDKSHCVGMYRIHQNGMYSMTPNEKKLSNKVSMQQELKKRFDVFGSKVITIIDSFAYNQNIRNKLYDTVKWMKEDGHDILLVSNTTIDKEILDNVKFYLYDSRNQLFQEKYENNESVVFFKSLVDGVSINDVVPVLQKHGLSVLVNLFNALLYAKAQGYTHFQRFEVDDIFGEKSRQFVKQVPYICTQENKNGLFYYNDNHNPPDISFHYFYCKIDDFLAKIPRISSERDYVEYLQKHYNNKKFKIVEVFIRENLKRNGDSEFIVKSGKDYMFVDLPDTIWNTETSISSFDSKYGKCTTRLYYINEYNKESSTYNRTNLFMVCTFSYHSEKTLRKIVVTRKNGETFTLMHLTEVANGWSWNEVMSDIHSISVYENDRFLYKEYADDCVSFVNILRK